MADPQRGILTIRTQPGSGQPYDPDTVSQAIGHPVTVNLNNIPLTGRVADATVDTDGALIFTLEIGS